MDFRFIQTIRDWANVLGLKHNYDVASFVGAAKSIAEPAKPSDREFLLRHIETPMKLHGIREVYLIHHLDCGAYGGKQAFENEQQERDKHIADLRESSRIIKEKFSKLEVKKVLARLTNEEVGEYEAQFEVIPNGISAGD